MEGMLEEILETTHIEFEKSSFLFDIIRHQSGKLYVEVKQTIHQEDNNEHSIKINPSIISEVIEILQNYETKILAEQTHDNSVNYLSKEVTDKIVKRYLKGISLQELSTQFGHEEKIIEMILRNRDIEIVSNNDKRRKWRRRKK